MTDDPGRTGRSRRRAVTLAAIILVQATAAVFFVGDVLSDMGERGHLDVPHLVMETVAAIALIAGMVFLVRELREIMRRMQSMESGLRAARGELARVMEEFFDRWGLTPAERDVALLLLKGLDNETIARMRGTARGTVRAQCAAIYGKAGVDGRAQLISVFLEELLGDGLSPGNAAEPGSESQPRTA